MIQKSRTKTARSAVQEPKLQTQKLEIFTTRVKRPSNHLSVFSDKWQLKKKYFDSYIQGFGFIEDLNISSPVLNHKKNMLNKLMIGVGDIDRYVQITWSILTNRAHGFFLQWTKVSYFKTTTIIYWSLPRTISLRIQLWILTLNKLFLFMTYPFSYPGNVFFYY